MLAIIARVALTLALALVAIGRATDETAVVGGSLHGVKQGLELLQRVRGIITGIRQQVGVAGLARRILDQGLGQHRGVFDQVKAGRVQAIEGIESCHVLAADPEQIEHIDRTG